MGYNEKKSISLIIVFCAISLTACDTLDFSGALHQNENANERFEQSMEWNSKNPARAFYCESTDYTLFVGSDLHVGSTVNFDKFLSDGKKDSATAFVLVGDLCTGHKSDYDVLKQHVADAAFVPCCLMAGNHDEYFDGWPVYYEYFGSSTYTFTITSKNATDLFICLESGSATLGSKQLDWLEQTLEDLRGSYRHCIVFGHSNYFMDGITSSTNPPPEELEFLLDLFADNNVDMVIMGHSHERAIDHIGNTTYLTLDAVTDDDNLPSYITLSIKDTGFSWEFVEL